MTNINTKVRLATITKVSTSLQTDPLPCLRIWIDFEFSDGGVCKGFSSNHFEDMFHLSTLFYYTGSDGSNVDSLKNKQVRVVITNGILTAIGHPTEDEFFQFQEYDNRLPLSKVI